jgi:puromycin-sensitive aminopeptidase
VLDHLDPYRLPTDVLPSAYRIRLDPDLQTGGFDGTVEIDVDVSRPVRTVVLNAVDFEFEPPELLAGGSSTVGEIELDVERERVGLTFPDPITPGSHTIALRFRGKLSELLVGFYRSTYVDDDGSEHPIATTHFETCDARRAFPCFDEPSFKATFEITLVAPAGMGAYSNCMVAREVDLADGRHEVTFAPTMKMSTYLVACIVGDFVQTPIVDVDGVPLAVVCRPSNVHLTAFALDVAAFSLRFFAEYFGIPYPGDKVDLVGVPDFLYGAMEQVGCVTFREQYLFADEKTASQDELVLIAEVIAHELAHMWFGDLVTMGWWEGLWLNEAFATYMSYLCVDAYRPSWKMWVRFARERELGLALDALHTTRSIEFPVRSPIEAADLVDPITYQKGGSVLRMLDQYLGEGVFRRGVHEYLVKHAYGNTVTADLWSALEAASGEPVGEIMDTWILQGGHPIVSVDAGSLTQHPFQYGPPTGPSAIGSEWKVPVLSRPLGGDGVARQLLGSGASRLAIEEPAVVNAGGSGVYRTSYGARELDVIGSRFDELSEIERSVLIGDTWALVRSGDRSIDDAVSLVARLGARVEPGSWDVATEIFDFLNRAIDECDRSPLATKARGLLAPGLEQLGWEPIPGEDVRTPLVRSTLIRLLGTVAQDDGVRSESIRRFEAGDLSGDLADSIVAVVASLARPGDDEVMLRRFQESTDPLSEERYRTGLALFADERVCLHTFATCFDTFRGQDAPIVIARLIINRVGGEAVWTAMTERWEELLQRVPPLMQNLLGIGLGYLVTDRAFLERAVAFHATHPLVKRQKSVEQALERLANSVTVAERERPAITKLLATT